ncbi:MAG: cupin domain-containing protein [Gemmatimonas sp.]|nr:cupin domain-containing protein [Gemmatimonas sp.]
MRAPRFGASIYSLSLTLSLSLCESRMRVRAAALFCALSVCSSAIGAQGAPAPQSPLKRTVLQTHALTSTPGHEGITVLAELSVGGSAPRHTHPGEEFVYVLEGTATFDMAGRPPLAIKAGDAFFIPPHTPHVATNTGKVPLKLLSNYIIPTGKPLATPAPPATPSTAAPSAP